MTDTALPPATPATTRSPKAARQAAPRWLDGRVVGGVLLVLLAVIIGYSVVNGAQRTSGYLAVDEPLERGHVVTEADLVVVQARLGSTAGQYLGSGQRADAVGLVVTRSLGAGELLPRAALDEGSDAPERIVSFPVASSRATDGKIAAGDLVDVLATYAQPAPGYTDVVAQAVQVVSVNSGGGGLAGGGDGVVITVTLRPDQVVGFTLASQTAELDVVRVVPDARGGTGDLGAAASASASPAASPAAPAPEEAPAAPAPDAAVAAPSPAPAAS